MGFDSCTSVYSYAVGFKLGILVHCILTCSAGPGSGMCLIQRSLILVCIVSRGVQLRTGHGKGKHKHVDGIDFDRSNLSINQMRPGLFAGEWHNNHHLLLLAAPGRVFFPTS